ncbi:hypothetical protein QTO34_006879, partial [Cnephaeus nilssonii]
MGQYAWGRPYIPRRILKTLEEIPRNWDSVYHGWHRLKRTPWWFYSLTIFLPAGGVIKHTAKALNHTWKALPLTVDETTQMHKVVLQTRRALGLHTATPGAPVPSCIQDKLLLTKSLLFLASCNGPGAPKALTSSPAVDVFYTSVPLSVSEPLL